MGKSNEFLLRRAAQENTAATSFLDKRTAIDTVQQNIRQNADIISDWLNNPNANGFLTIDGIHKYSIGYGVNVNSYGTAAKNVTYGLTNSKIFMVKDLSMPNGYRIITAYPTFNGLKEPVFLMMLGFRSCLIDNKRKERFREVNIKEFNTIGYFIKYYFNWSMNYAELEDCIEDFLTREKEEDIKAFIKEIERMYILNDPELIRKVAYELGDRGMPTDKALYMIKLLYTKTQQKKKQLTHYLA